MTSKSKRIAQFVVSNSLFIWCAWEAVHGNIGAGRILSFFSWTLGPLLFLSSFNKEVCKSIREKGRSVPSWLSHGIGYSVIAFLVYHGWINVAIAWLLAEIGEAILYSKDDKEEEPA